MDEKTVTEAVKAAAPILQKGHRVLLIPVREGGVRIFQVDQKEIKSNTVRHR